MKAQHIIKFIITVTLMIILSACSSGPAEKPLPDSISSPARLLDQGISHYNNNNYPSAIHDFKKSLLQYRSIDNQTGIANSCMNLAKTYMAINNNETAAAYLSKANTIIDQAKLSHLTDHLRLLNSSLAIKTKNYEKALQELNLVLDSKNIGIKLAALKNRTSIAFIRDDKDKQQWLTTYKTQQRNNPDNTTSHEARILRFEAELSNDENRKIELLTQSLVISQQLANRTAIAATLTQWANIDFKNKRYPLAEDKNIRALFIRHQLSDVKNTQIILLQLQAVYAATGNTKEALTRKWINKLSSNELTGWERLFSDFDTYP